jgi:hypothetical protein
MMVANKNPNDDDEVVDDRLAHRKARASHLRWLKLGDLVPLPHAQRTFSQAWGDALAADFHLEGLGFFVVSIRDGVFGLLDGQHRRYALLKWGFSLEDTIQCECYEGLTPKEESEMFLERNHIKPIEALTKFERAVDAERPDEVAIKQVVALEGLRIGHRARGESAQISSVSCLHRVVGRIGYVGLGRVLRIIRDAYGDRGFESPTIDGVSLFLQRHPNVDDLRVIESLRTAMGGLTGLWTSAQMEHVQLGAPKVQCIAAEIVKACNRNLPNGKKLRLWWKE